MTPAGNQINRVISVTPVVQASQDGGQTSADDDLIRKFRKLGYGDRIEFREGKHTFSGEFSGKLPADTDGAGWYTHLESPLGSLSVYQERLLGRDDALGILKQFNAQIDELLDLTTGWIDYEFEDSPLRDHLHSFVDQDLTADAKNLGLTMLRYSGRIPNNDEEGNRTAWDVAGRSIQYLMERQYVDPVQLPIYSRAFIESDASDICQLVFNALERKLALSPEEAEQLGVISDPKLLEASIRSFLRTTQQFAVITEEWQKKNPEDFNGPNPMSVISDPLFKILFFSHQDQSTKFEVRLRTESEPFASNGSWNSSKKFTTWERTTSQRGDAAVIHASWSEPNENQQKQALGEVCLRDQPLAKYVVWWNGLTDTEQHEWNSLLQVQTATKNLLDRLDGFEFSEPTPMADEGIRLIKEAMKQHQSDE